MKRNKLIIFSAIFLLLFGTSCEKPVSNFELIDHEPKIVLNTILEADSNIIVFAARSFDLNDSKKLTNEISKLDIHLQEASSHYSFSQVATNYYSSVETIVKENTVYTLKASAPGYHSVNASVKIPARPLIESLDTGIRFTTEPDCLDCDPEYFVNTKIRIKDNAKTADYYQVEFFILHYSEENETVTRSVPIEGYIVSPFIDFSERYNSLSPSDINSVSYGNSFYLSDQSFNGKTISLSFLSEAFTIISQIYTYKPEKNKTEVDKSIVLSIRLSKISKDLYFHLSALAQNDASGDFPLTEPVYIPTNINDGLGILGAKATTENIVDLKDLIRQIENIYNPQGVDNSYD